jgi:hypothetical protein
MRASNLDTHNVQGKNGSRILDSAADKSLRRTDDALACSQRARTPAFQAMNDAQLRSILAKTVNAASRDEFELFKTTFFDVTAQNPAWLGEDANDCSRDWLPPNVADRVDDSLFLATPPNSQNRVTDSCCFRIDSKLAGCWLPS